MVEVNIDNFLDVYVGDIPKMTFDKMLDAQFNGAEIFLLSGTEHDRIIAKHAKREELWARQEKAAELNSKGSQAEKEGHIEEAISIYEENIKSGVWPTYHPYKRLCILYRKLGDRANEVRVMEAAIKAYKNTNDTFFQDRLEKLNKMK